MKSKKGDATYRRETAYGIIFALNSHFDWSNIALRGKVLYVLYTSGFRPGRAVVRGCLRLRDQLLNKRKECARLVGRACRRHKDYARRARQLKLMNCPHVGLVVTNLAESHFTERKVDRSDSHCRSDASCFADCAYNIVGVALTKNRRRGFTSRATRGSGRTRGSRRGCHVGGTGSRASNGWRILG